MFRIPKNLSKKSPGDMWLLVGLGNPGAGYENNRHNIGFMAIDRIASHHSFPIFRLRLDGLMAEGTIDGRKTILLKPQTYMNNSGQSVRAVAKYFKIEPDHIVVFHDELDLSPGKVRTKMGGGNAGHNGLRSIEDHLGTPDYARVRMGIGHPGEREKVHGHVLKDFAKGERIWLEPLLKAVADHSALVVQNELPAYINKIAAAAPAPAPSTPESKTAEK